MGEKTALGYLILAVRASHLNVSVEEKLVEAFQKMMQEHLPSDALDLYLEWIGFDNEMKDLESQEVFKAELEQAAASERRESA